MGENTAIEWCTHSFNHIWGCEEISPACDHCYARAWAARVGMPELWQGQYRLFGDKHWREPLKWDAAAKLSGIRCRIFCASMADVFDNKAPESERQKLWELIRATPNSDWLLLTKRIGNAKSMLPPDWGGGYTNVWLGSTVANQEEADRDTYKLLMTPARIHFLSVEPMLGRIILPRFVRLHADVRGDFPIGHQTVARARLHAVKRNPYGARSVQAENGEWLGIKPSECTDIDASWAICGGESGSKARPMSVSWAQDLRDQCASAGIAFFMKQLSGRLPEKRLEYFPPGLRVREWPSVNGAA